MATIGFYQLTLRPLDSVLPRLLEKARAAGHRILVRHPDPALLKHLDILLWSYEPASFLPHGCDGDAQPILLTGSPGNPNAADLLAVPGGDLPEDAASFERVLYLFDGNDAAALAHARDEWRALKQRDDVTPVYWREGEGGRWEQAG